MPASLDQLLHHPAIWRGEGIARRGGHAIPTGFQALDVELPCGGWPYPGLIEVLCDRWGHGEISLFLPALVHSTTAEAGRAIAWINPPHWPYPVALARCGLRPERQWLTGSLTAVKAAWAMEQALRSSAFACVLGWLPQADMRALRRLKLAAETGICLGVLFSPQRERDRSSPATLRMAIEADVGDEIRLELIKVQGGRPRTMRLPVER